MIVVDTGGMIALIDADDNHHDAVRQSFDEHGSRWILPWAILPEVDYIVATRLGAKVAEAFVKDLRDGLFTVDNNITKDLPRACALLKRHADLRLGLVDAVVMAQAERHAVEVILTTDGRDFRAVRLDIDPPPRLIPIDG